ncbi:MAG: MiaB/RimO family radical SAM methylthiotransferase, partial [Planctomycetota bacterium]
MKTFSTTTLGCKVNQYESQQIRQLLEELGLTQTQPTEQPDLLVINTCCITHTASAKSRQSIRKSQKLNPHSAIVVTGCLTAAQLDEMNDITTANLNIVSNHQSLANTLRRIVQGQTTDLDPGISQSQDNHRIIAYNHTKIKLKNGLSNLSQLPSLTSYKGHTRAFLKVQDGCDSCCSYCIVPKTRPLIHSKDTDSVLREAIALADIGHKEIVITGVNLGAYNQKSTRRKSWSSPENDQLPILLDRLAQIENLKRIRISSLAPADVTDLLIETIAKHPNIMPHLHLSLQSGSDNTLKRMCRQYSTEDFLKIVEKIKKNLDSPAITSDIIVGFPGETDKDFQKTIDLAKKV